MTVTFACQHTQPLEQVDTIPICRVCGERRVQIIQAPAPRFTGICRGPSATFEALASVGVPLSESGAQPLLQEEMRARR